jgi:hypothetical protein
MDVRAKVYPVPLVMIATVELSGDTKTCTIRATKHHHHAETKQVADLISAAIQTLNAAA